MINIFDGNNYVRREMERSLDGLLPRDLFIRFSASTETNIIVWDGDNGNARRRALYPKYKVFDKRNQIPIWGHFEIVREVLAHSKAIQIRHNDWEADDIIATLTRRFAGAGEQVAIWSKDFDFMQLAAEFPARVFCGADPKPTVPAELVRYYKVTVGDTSDKIPGIPWFGDETWNRIDRDRLAGWIDIIVRNGTIPAFKGLPKRCKPNADHIRTFWKLVSFYDVPMAEIDAVTRIGTSDVAAGAALLERYLQ